MTRTLTAYKCRNDLQRSGSKEFSIRLCSPYMSTSTDFGLFTEYPIELENHQQNEDGAANGKSRYW